MATNYDYIIRKGNLGVGTASPAYKLDVNGSAAFGATTQTEIGDAGTTPTINYGMFHNTGVGLGIASLAGGSTQGIQFWSHNGSSFFESVRIAGSTGNVGIGTTSPKTSLDIVKDADIWHFMVGGATKKLLIGGQAVSGDVVLQAGSASTPNNAVPTTTYNLTLQRDGGNVGIGTPSPGTKLHVSGAISGSSINFGQNDLNFYEEGTWTPALDTTNNNLGTVNYNGEPTGVYTRIGNVVHAWFDIDVNDITLGANTGTGTIDDLPYASNSNIGVFSSLVITEGDLLGPGSAGTQVKGYVAGGEDRITIDYYDSGTNGFGVSGRSLFDSINGGILSGYITYQV